MQIVYLHVHDKGCRWKITVKKSPSGKLEGDLTNAKTNPGLELHHASVARILASVPSKNFKDFFSDGCALFQNENLMALPNER